MSVLCHSVPISIPILVSLFFMYNILCYYRLYLLTLSSGYILYSYDIVYLIINISNTIIIGIILLFVTLFIVYEESSCWLIYIPNVTSSSCYYSASV